MPHADELTSHAARQEPCAVAGPSLQLAAQRDEQTQLRLIVRFRPGRQLRTAGTLKKVFQRTGAVRVSDSRPSGREVDPDFLTRHIPNHRLGEVVPTVYDRA